MADGATTVEEGTTALLPAEAEVLLAGVAATAVDALADADVAPGCDPVAVADESDGNACCAEDDCCAGCEWIAGCVERPRELTTDASAPSAVGLYPGLGPALALLALSDSV